MNIGDLVYDDDYRMYGIIIGDDGDRGDHPYCAAPPEFTVLYEDGSLGEANAVDLELT